jgi:hypothetical protein
LHQHLVGLAAPVEIIDVQGAGAGLQGGVDGVQRNAHRQGLGLVHFDVELRRGNPEEGVQAGQLGTLLEGFDELGGDRGEVLGVAIGPVLHIHLEAAGGAEALDGRRVEDQAHAVGEAHADAHELAGHLAGGHFAFVPGLEDDEGGGDAGPVVAGDEVHAIHEEDVLDVVGHDALAHLFGGDVGSLVGRAVGEGDEAEQVALVFGRHEAARHDAQQAEGGSDGQQEDQRADDAVAQGQADGVGVEAGEALESPVEGAEDRALLVGRLEQQGAQGRREGQGDDPRDHHRYRYRDGELLIELAGDATEEGYRHEYRAQHQHDGDDRTGNFAHRFDGGVLRRQLLFVHQAFDVLEYDDGVIHHDADGQHHGKQGQGVDRKAEQPHAGKGADQRHRHGHDGDQRGAPVLQEDVHHGDHQQGRLAEGP